MYTFTIRLVRQQRFVHYCQHVLHTREDRERDQRRRHHVRCHVITNVNKSVVHVSKVLYTFAKLFVRQRSGVHVVNVCCTRPQSGVHVICVSAGCHIDHDREQHQRRRHHVRCHVITGVSSVLCTSAGCDLYSLGFMGGVYLRYTSSISLRYTSRDILPTRLVLDALLRF